METKDIIQASKKFDFTWNSIWFAFLSVVALSIIIIFTVGFDTREDTILSLALICSFLLFCLLYSVVVIYKYKKLPKNKSKDKAGVLFIINTHNNTKDYKNIREKFLENFEHFVSDRDACKIMPIVLTEKQVLGLKHYDNVKNAQKLMKKTNCIMFVSLTTYDLGDKSTKYQLKISALVFHPNMNNVVAEVFTRNINTIFSSLYINEIDRKNDLKDLQLLSNKLYFVCQIIFATANEYTGYFIAARKIYSQLVDRLKNPTDNFYRQIKKIAHIELFNCCKLLLTNSYEDYINNGVFNPEKVRAVICDMETLIKNVNTDDAIQYYYLYKAIYDVLLGNFGEANKTVERLKKKYENIPQNQRPWAYSESFLFACQATNKQFATIEKKYKSLKNNRSQDVNRIYLFINQFMEQNPSNIGVKQALFWLVYYRKDLNLEERISQQFIEQLIRELRNNNCNSLADNIETKYNESIVDTGKSTKVS